MQLSRIWSAVWNRKTTLFLLVLGQAVNLYIWQMQSLTTVAYLHDYAAFAIAILTAFALDSAQVQIAIAQKTRRVHWIIAGIASIVFLTLGIWIAIDVMKDALHAAFAVGVFMYSWYDALVHMPVVTTPVVTPAPLTLPRQVQYPAPIKASTHKYICPKCNAPVAKSSIYRVRKRGYCSKCKGK